MKTMHSRWLAACTAFLAFIGSATATLAATYTTVSGTFRYGYAQQVLTLVNQQRQAYGLQPLIMTQNLTDAAMKRAAECVVRWDPYEHIRPNGQDCWTAWEWSGHTAENIQKGAASPSAVMTSWMNSTGHRNNILSPKAGFIGIGCFQYGGTLYWTQAFSGSATSGKDTRSSTLSATVKVSKTSGVDSIVTIGSTPTPSPSGTCTIRFNANGGKGTMANQGIAYGATAKLRKNAFTRSGYTFQGWAVSASGDIKYKDQASLKNASTGNYSITLYARWSVKAVFTRPTATKGRASAYVKVAWTANPFSNYGYYVYRTPTKQFKNAVRLGFVTTRSYIDRTAVRGTKYWYWVAPVRKVSSKLRYVLPTSGTAAVAKQAGYRTVGIPKPAVKSGSTGVKLAWKASPSSKKGYVIYRGTSKSYSKASKLATTKSRSYMDKSAYPGRTYYYWIGVVGSNAIWVQADRRVAGRRSLVVSTPKAALAKTCNYAHADVSWKAVYGAKSYKVYRGTSWAARIRVGNTTSNSWHDELPAKNGKKYYYWICAVDVRGAYWYNKNKYAAVVNKGK